MSIVRYTLIVFLIISSVIQLFLGIQLFTNTEELLPKFGINVENSPESFASIKVMTNMIGKFLLNFCIITAIATFFVWKDNKAGLILSLFFGLTMVVGGLISLKSGGGTLFLLVDSVRGLIIFILSFLLLFF